MVKAKSTKVTKAEWKGYHNVNLSREQNELFTSEYLPVKLLWSDIDILTNNGYKFSVVWDDYNSGVTASLYACSKKMEWAGYALTAWAGDCETATKLLLFKHYVACEEIWSPVKPERAGSDVKWG